MAAADAISVDVERHACAVIVVVDIYPEIMRQMIINSYPPPTIGPMVQCIINQLTHPFTKSLNDYEKNILETLAKEGYRRCDVSLMYKLIRHFNLVEPPTRQWGCQPQPNEIKQGDDVERMKRYRNDILHRPRGGLSQNEKSSFFQESEEIARRIDAFIGSPANGFENRIQTLKSYTVTKEKYIEILEKFNNLQERFKDISENVHVALHYGNDIEAKFHHEEQSGVTNCSLYVRDPNMDVQQIVEKLDEVKQQLNNGNYNIRLRGAENKCLAIHIEINKKCFEGKKKLHEDIEYFLRNLFKFTSLDKILRSPVDVVLAESDNTFDMDKNENSMEGLNQPDNVLKLDVEVDNTVFQSNVHLYHHVNQLCSEIFNLTGQEIPTNGSALGVVIAVEGTNDKQLKKSPNRGRLLHRQDPEELTPYQLSELYSDTDEGLELETIISSKSSTGEDLFSETYNVSQETLVLDTLESKHLQLGNEERELMVREFMELFKGRCTYEGTRRILEHVNWEKGRAVGFMLKSNPSDVTKIATMSEDTVTELKTDPEVLDNLKYGIRSTVRQFACEGCDNVWWWRVPIRKQVSKCKHCKLKYDPVPKEKEWGRAIFDCKYCGNQFRSYGQMSSTIRQCYECKRQVQYPTSIIKSNRRTHRRRTTYSHCSSGQNCKHGDVPIHDDDPERVYEDNPRSQSQAKGSNQASGQRIQASFPRLTPESRTYKKKVIYPSQPHKSTGSTVGTFLTQDDISSSYNPSLKPIREEKSTRW